MAEHFDVIIVGAGLSGVGAACQLQRKRPRDSFVVLEARDAIGGTWDLFRYPGIRSDSDMFTLGYHWKPWANEKAIADGASILRYVRETAQENALDAKIRFGHRVKRAVWSSERALWTIDVESGASRELRRFTCRFLSVCSGYFAYDAGYAPRFEGMSEFAGQVVHPQHWSDELEYAGKRVVVIGSGATAMTLVPELAKKAAHVVMLQRSPTYVVSAPAKDPLANALRSLFPAKLAYAITRWKNILLGLLFFQLVRFAPALAKRELVKRVSMELGPGHDVERHFTPRYNPWDQRVCLVPDGDLFEAIRAARVTVVTDQIETFTKSGIRLQSGQELAADLVVTATGLEVLFLGGIELSVDGHAIELGQTMSYKGCMFSDVPNLSYTFGYTNASWTLKADLTAHYVCRLLSHMEKTGATHCTPRRTDPSIEEQPFLDFSSTYIRRALARLPSQGSKRPFRLYQNYPLDLLTLRYGTLADGTLEFARADSKHAVVAELPSATPGPSR